MNQPFGVFVDGNDNLWVSDTGNHRIVLFKNARLKPNGAAADGVIGQANLASVASGLGARRLSDPYGISFEPWRGNRLGRLLDREK